MGGNLGYFGAELIFHKGLKSQYALNINIVYICYKADSGGSNDMYIDNITHY